MSADQPAYDYLPVDERNAETVLTAAAPGEAPEGLGSTGDPLLNRVWTFLHVPCVTLPVLAGPAGLPLGLQVIGRQDADRALLEVCRWIEARLPVCRTLDSALSEKLEGIGRV